MPSPVNSRAAGDAQACSRKDLRVAAATPPAPALPDDRAHPHFARTSAQLAGHVIAVYRGHRSPLRKHGKLLLQAFSASFLGAGHVRSASGAVSPSVPCEVDQGPTRRPAGRRRTIGSPAPLSGRRRRHPLRGGRTAREDIMKRTLLVAAALGCVLTAGHWAWAQQSTVVQGDAVKWGPGPPALPSGAQQSGIGLEGPKQPLGSAPCSPGPGSPHTHRRSGQSSPAFNVGIGTFMRARPDGQPGVQAGTRGQPSPGPARTRSFNSTSGLVVFAYVNAAATRARSRLAACATGASGTRSAGAVSSGVIGSST
jgi:hypothetical protein